MTLSGNFNISGLMAHASELGKTAAHYKGHLPETYDAIRHAVAVLEKI